MSMAWSKAAWLRYQTLQGAMPEQDAILYGLVDTAAHDGLYDALMNEPAASHVLCLFDGVAGIRYARVAPYVFVIHPQSALAQRWLDAYWSSPVGLFVTTALAPDKCRRHFKTLLHVELPGKQQALFRFYDPRVMERMMPTLQPGQRGDLFGLDRDTRVDAVLLPQPGDRVLRYTPGPQNLGMRFAQACPLSVDVFTASDASWR